MSSNSRATIFQQVRPDIVRRYVFDDLSLEKLKEEMEHRPTGLALKLTTAQWKSLLREWGIFKKICDADADFIWTGMEKLECEMHQCLVLADGILCDLFEVKRYRDRKGAIKASCNLQLRARHFIFVPLPFKFSRLGNLEVFKSFQRLLWHTKVHFDSCFDTNKWKTDERGIYGRSDELITGLTKLSKLHNMYCDILNHFSRGENVRWEGALVRTTFRLHKSVVRTGHHRQFPDLLAIAQLMEKKGKSDLRSRMAKDLYNLAEIFLEDNDPRRNMFQELISIPLDSTGDIYLAFDAFCRELWIPRAGSDYIKAYYSYNQASLPRAAPGQFYDLYKGKTLPEINFILQQVDEMFGQFDHTTICLWHTAIRYLLQERKYTEAEDIGRALSSRLSGLQDFQPRQLNVDTSLTFYLLGSAQNSLGMFGQAMCSFTKCMDIRSVLVPKGVWDPTLASALRRLEELARRLPNSPMVGTCNDRLYAIYSAVEKEDLTKQFQYSDDSYSRELLLSVLKLQGQCALH